MPFKPFHIVKSRTIVLREDNIDTDQIIPARFLTTVTQKGLGGAVFFDWRYDETGALREDSPLDAVDVTKHQILVAGRNFGCGSSREHAPWALADFGFRAVISSDIADIFKSNALKNGLLPVEVDGKTHNRLLETPGDEVTIELEKQTVKLFGGWQAVFDVDPFARRCLLDGVDPMGYLIQRLPEIEAFERKSA